MKKNASMDLSINGSDEKPWLGFLQKSGLHAAVYYSAFFLIFLFLIWKCSFGYANNDESFYLTVPYRLCMGDGLFVHEWHVSQLSSVILYPIVKLYLAIFGSTEGMLLHFRWIFTVVWSIVSLIIGFRLRGYGRIGSYIASLVLLIYTPFGIMALSYNSMGILALICACVFLISSKTMLGYVFSGIAAAGAFLCCPFLIILYFAFSLISLIKSIKKEKGAFRRWLFVSIGCFIVFAAFCIFVFTRCSLKEFFEALPLIMDDPEHSNMSLFGKTFTFFFEILKSNLAAALTILGCFIVLILNLKKKVTAHKGFCIICALVVVYISVFLLMKRSINYLMFPICLLGFYCALTSKNKRIRTLFYWLYLPGVVYAFVLNYSSNQLFNAIASAATLSAVSTVMILPIYIKEMLGTNADKAIARCTLSAAAILLCVQLGAELYLRYTSLFWEREPIAAQTVIADKGPEKGIRITPKKSEEYELLMKQIDPVISDSNVKSVLFLTKRTTAYLYAQKGFSTYSAWLSGITKQSLERLKKYYSLNPEKLPDAVMLDVGDNDALFAEYFTLMGYSTEQGSGVIYLKPAR